MQMIIASRLVDGRVVFMGADARWAESIEDGVLLSTDEETAQLMSAAEQAIERCEIVDAYPIEVVVENGERRPVEVREAIRAFGPSVRSDQLDS
jgi:hypothetical protein